MNDVRNVNVLFCRFWLCAGGRCQSALLRGLIAYEEKLVLFLFGFRLFNVPHHDLPIQPVFLCKGSVCCGGSQYLGEDVKFLNQDFVPLVFFFVCHFLFISLFVIFGCKDKQIYWTNKKKIKLFCSTWFNMLIYNNKNF